MKRVYTKHVHYFEEGACKPYVCMCAHVLQSHALLLQKRNCSFRTAASTASHIKWPVTFIVSPAAVMKASKDKNQCHMKCKIDNALLYIH